MTDTFNPARFSVYDVIETPSNLALMSDEAVVEMLAYCARLAGVHETQMSNAPSAALFHAIVKEGEYSTVAARLVSLEILSRLGSVRQDSP